MIIFCVPVSGFAASYDVDHLLNSFQKKAKKYNKERTYESYMKYIVDNDDQVTIKYIKGKHSKGALRGKLPKIEVKKGFIFVGSNKIEISNLTKLELKVNNYKLNFKKHMRPSERLAYIEKVLKHNKKASWNFIIPKAYAEDKELVPTVGAISSIISDSPQEIVSEGLIDMNKNLTYGFGISDYQCKEGAVQMDFKAPESGVEMTWLE